MDLQLIGKRALVCGGSSGLGRAVAAALVGEGVHVALLSRNADRLRDVAADGITVNTLLPGRIDTPRIQRLDQAAAERTGTSPQQARADSVKSIPVGRVGTPEEFGAVAAFLSSPLAAYVTGSMIRVDGGSVRAI